MASRARSRAVAEKRLRNIRLRATRIRAANPASRSPWRRARLCSTLRIVRESPDPPGKTNFLAIRTTLGCSQLCVNNNNKTYKKLRGRSKDLRGKLVNFVMTQRVYRKWIARATRPASAGGVRG